MRKEFAWAVVEGVVSIMCQKVQPQICAADASRALGSEKDKGDEIYADAKVTEQNISTQISTDSKTWNAGSAEQTTSAWIMRDCSDIKWTETCSPVLSKQ